MAYSYIKVTAAAGQTSVPFSFDYLATSEIKVKVNDVETTAWSLSSPNVVALDTAMSGGEIIEIERVTNLTTRVVDFASGAFLKEEDLDLSAQQVFNAAQEALDSTEKNLSETFNGQYDAKNKRIVNIADPTDAQDVVTKNWAETGMSSQLATATAKASEASTSASSASASETAAASSASTASTKASEASVSAANAAVSATNAAQSSASAATSATNAATSATNASTSESNASSDATTASNAASTATSQASVASSAATTATSQATSATNSANAAASSESNASTSATNAATSATSASTSASQAQGYRDTTLGYKDSAAASATGALSSKNAAATSETNAAASESSAAADASTATTKASEAATSASNAATSATNAASSASAAAQSAIDAADAANFDPTDYAQTANNLSDLVSAPSALTNLGIANHDDITVDGSGNVGIGTSSPVAKFDLRGNASIGPANTTDVFQGLSFVQGKDSSVANAINYIDFKNNLSTPDAHIFADHITDGSSAIIFGTTSSGSRSTDRRQERMRVTTSGISVTGNIAVTGTVDGRDVAADGAKLDGIEAGATADQTKADIDALGIDADTVDGLHASSFALKSGTELEKYITFNDYDDGSAANTGLRTFVRDGTWYVNNDVSASNTINISLGGRTVWHAGNDGSGSGLDADTLDGLDSTAFGRLATAADWSRTQSYNRVTLTDAATINWNMATSPSAIVSLSANRTMGNPTNIKAGNWYTLRVYHSGAPRTLAWSSRWKFGGNGAPELSTLANDYDVLTFYALSTTALSFVGIAKNIAAA